MGLVSRSDDAASTSSAITGPRQEDRKAKASMLLAAIGTHFDILDVHSTICTASNRLLGEDNSRESAPRTRSHAIDSEL